MTSVARLVFSVLGEVRRVMEKDMERRGKLYLGLGFIKREMEAVNALIKDSKEKYQGAVQETRIRQLQELAYDIDDFVEDLWEPGKYGLVLVAIGMDRRPQQLDNIEQFKKTIEALVKDWGQSAESSQDRDPDHGAGSSVEMDPEVIDGPKKKLVELLSPSPAELRVISIVGCRGVGKTALARSVYKDTEVRSQFDCVGWFEASGCNNKEALLSMTPEDDETQAGGTNAPANLRTIPAGKRYLVFIDDVQQQHVWKDTVDALSTICKSSPENVKGSRIIMTTSVHSISSARSSGSYVYRMQCLGKRESNTIFWSKVFGCQTNPPCSLVTGSDSIFSKCDGLPLALTSVAKYLSTKGECLESRDCKEVGKNLGRIYLSSNSAVGEFGKMRRALGQCYESLPDYDHRSCLLYLSIFPMCHQIKSKSLVRRLMAEGLVADAEDGCKFLDNSTDQCIVDPVQFSSDSRDAKRCKVHGVVLEYIIQKSVSKNFVTLIQKEEDVRKADSTVARVRRLSVQSSAQETCDEDATRIGLSDVRSLTIFNSVFNFRSCKMLRLLDLEGCTGIDNSFLDGICELLLLKYLSLRKTGVNKLPTQIKKLQRLETLDIRDTQEIELPIQVIMLPRLAYLFGKFELPEVPKVNNSLKDFLLHKSELQTLAGFVVNKKQGPEQVILLARKLKKVKIWCNDTSADAPMSLPIPELASSSAACSDRPPRKPKCCHLNPFKRKVESQDNNPPLKKAKEGQSNNFDFIRLLKMRFTSLESVSIVSSGLCRDILGSIEGPCAISSIKLWGKLESLPNSKKLSELRYLDSINKLQLFSTGLSSEDLSALQSLRCLEYLKLAEDGDGFCNGMFIVEKSGFESLKRLCIEAPKLPKLQFNEGAMGRLASLHLLCPDSPQVQETAETVVGILHLTSLNEVVLHSSASKAATLAWEKVADGHPKRPCVNQGPKQKDNTAA